MRFQLWKFLFVQIICYMATGEGGEKGLVNKNKQTSSTSSVHAGLHNADARQRPSALSEVYDTKRLIVVRKSVEIWQPYFRIAPDGMGGVQYSGIMWDLLVMLSARIGFRFEILRPPDGKWGLELSNGSWNGMLGMIHRKEVEMAIGPFAVSYARSRIVDYPAPLFILPHRLYLPRPTGQSDLSDYVKLFHPTVWYLTLLSGAVVAVVAWLILQRPPDTRDTKVPQVTADDKASSSTPSITVIAFNIWAMLFQQSSWWRGTGRSKIIVGMWLLVSLVLMNTYRGLLVASLSVPRVQIPISSVEQLVQQTSIPWRLEQGGIILHTFKTADVAMYKTLLDGNSGFFPDCFAARKDIATGQFAGLCDTLSGDIMISKSYAASGQCEFYVPRQNIVTHTYSLVLAKKSALLEPMRYWLQELQERGWVDKLLRMRVDNGTICSLPPGKESGGHQLKALGLDTLWGVFAILAAGICIAGLVFLVEQVQRK
ncbi:unnamed protein product, partial [Meganyctiphanes norvegica]